MEQNINEEELNKNNFFTQHVKGKYLILSLTILIILIIILVGISFLTKNKEVVENKTVQVTPTESPKISLPCPTVQSFCHEGKKILSGGEQIGIGGILPKGTPIYAVFDGKLVERVVDIQEKSGFNEYTKIDLISNDNSLTGEYYVKVGRVKKSKVKKGDKILTLSNVEIIDKNNNYNFVFKLINNKQQILVPFNDISFL